MSTAEKFICSIHEFERARSSKTTYRCIHPRCNYKYQREFLVGKAALCHKCKNIFILTWKQLRNKYPVCDFCTRSPQSQELKNLRETSLSLLSNLPEDIKKEILDKTLE